MLRPIKIRFQNLLSHQDSTYNFLDNKTILVSGVNLDDKGVDSNGSGKSTIIEALAISLTGSPFRDIKNSDLISNDKDFLEIEFDLEDAVKGLNYKIIRRLFSNKPSRVELWVNGKVNESLKDLAPKESNKYIQELLDLTNDDLLNYFIVSKETYKSFFLSTDGQKKEIINRFSKAYLVENVEAAVKIDIGHIEGQILLIEREKLSIESKIQVYDEQLSEASERGNERLYELKLEYKSESERAAIIDKQELGEINKKRKALKKEIDEIKVGDHEHQLQEINSLSREFIGLKKDYSDKLKTIISEEKENKEMLHNVDHVLAGVIECPSCSHEFLLGNEAITIEEAREMRPLLDKELNALNEARIEINSKIEEYESDLEILETQKEEIIAEKKQLEDRQTIKQKEYNKLDQDYEAKMYEWNKTKEKVIYLKNEIEKLSEEDQTLEIKKNIKLLNEKLQEVLLNLTKEQNKLSELQYCAANFKKFRSYLANQSIKAIESYTNHFLQQMNTNLSVKIDGFRLLANGKIKEEIETSISRDGFTSENFNKFSSGEKTKVDIAGILALQSIINNNSNVGLNLLCLDEIIESVDGTAAREILRSLKLLNQNILVITHTSYNSEFENTLRVEKKNGISKILN